MLLLVCSGYALRAPRLTSAPSPLRRPYCCDGWSTLDEASWVIEDVEEEEDEESMAARAWEEESTLGSAAPLARRTAPEAAAAALRDDGVVCVGPALGAVTAAALRAEVLTQLEAAHACEAGAGPLSSVLTASAGAAGAITRWDLRLRVTAPVAAGLRELLSAPAVASSLLDAAGREAELWELAALVSAPGAAPQPLHADTLWDEERKRCSRDAARSGRAEIQPSRSPDVARDSGHPRLWHRPYSPRVRTILTSLGPNSHGTWPGRGTDSRTHNCASLY